MSDTRRFSIASRAGIPGSGHLSGLGGTETFNNDLT